MTGADGLVIKHDREGVRYVQPYLGTNKVTGRPMRPYKRFPDAETDEEALAMSRIAAQMTVMPALVQLLVGDTTASEFEDAVMRTAEIFAGKEADE